MTIGLCLLSALFCLYFARLELLRALAGKAHSIFSIIVHLFIIIYYIVPLILFNISPNGPWKFMYMVGDQLQPTDLLFASSSITILIILLIYTRFFIRPLGLSHILNVSNFKIDRPSRVSLIAFYSTCIIAVGLYVLSIYAAGGFLSFAIGGKLLKAGSSNLSTTARILRYFAPLIYYVLVTLSVWLTNFYHKKSYLTLLFLVLGIIFAFSSGSRGQILGFLLTNLYIYAIIKLSWAKHSLQSIILPFRVSFSHLNPTIFLSKRKSVFLIIFFLCLTLSILGLPYFKSFIWSIPSLASGESMETVLILTSTKYQSFFQSGPVFEGPIDYIVNLYSSLDHPLASFLAVLTSKTASYLPSHQLDFVNAIKSLITPSNSGINTPSMFFQDFFQKFTSNPLGFVPPSFLAASIYYHTLYLWIPAVMILFYILSSFDLCASRFRFFLDSPSHPCSPLRAYIFVWACLFPTALFNYLFFPDWFMSVYKSVSFLLFSLPLFSLFIKGSRQ